MLNGNTFRPHQTVPGHYHTWYKNPSANTFESQIIDILSLRSEPPLLNLSLPWLSGELVTQFQPPEAGLQH